MYTHTLVGTLPARQSLSAEAGASSLLESVTETKEMEDKKKGTNTQHLKRCSLLKTWLGEKKLLSPSWLL